VGQQLPAQQHHGEGPHQGPAGEHVIIASPQARGTCRRRTADFVVVVLAACECRCTWVGMRRRSLLRAPMTKQLSSTGEREQRSTTRYATSRSVGSSLKNE
jgi:hypothetical protein